MPDSYRRPRFLEMALHQIQCFNMKLLIITMKDVYEDVCIKYILYNVDHRDWGRGHWGKGRNTYIPVLHAPVGQISSTKNIQEELWGRELKAV